MSTVIDIPPPELVRIKFFDYLFLKINRGTDVYGLVEDYS